MKKHSQQILDFQSLSPEDNIVLVLGPTGVGKSSFIEVATGVSGLAGDSLSPCTRDITIIKGSFPELYHSDVYFVDTPGFDDTEKTELDLFTDLSNWLIEACKKRVRFRGVLYFHRISDNRLTGTSLQNLRHCAQLCGNNFNRIVLTTTMWDEVSKEKGEELEDELQRNFWQSVMDRGSVVRRFYRDRNSVIEVLSPLFRTTIIAREVSPGELSEQDHVIALMGPTGSGKSSFLEIASGVKGLVSHDLESSSCKISVVKLSCPEFLNSDVCFVDTPGFDNTQISDLDIFKMLSDWLNDSYQRKIRLTGLLYFQRISDNRISGTPLQNLRFFERLCGRSFHNIVLATTMWDKVDEKIGLAREEELNTIFWGTMIARGSTVKRFKQTRASAFEVLKPIFEEIDNRGVLLLQREMSDLGLQLKQTSAGRTLFANLEETISRQRSLLDALRAGLIESISEDERIQLEEQKERISKELNRALGDMQQLKISVIQKIFMVYPIALWSWVLSNALLWSSKEKEAGTPTRPTANQN